MKAAELLVALGTDKPLLISAFDDFVYVTPAGPAWFHRGAADTRKTRPAPESVAYLEALIADGRTRGVLP